PTHHHFFSNATPSPEIYTLSLHDALPIFATKGICAFSIFAKKRPINTFLRNFNRANICKEIQLLTHCNIGAFYIRPRIACPWCRSEEHTSELQSRENLVCRLLLEKKKKSI